jgi:formate dehydrogenase major subunit
MTNHYIDFRNADVILNMGGNVAENHPVSFKWIQAAKDKGAIFIHVDPRFTRTSTKADIFARLRSGTDIAFLGGMIKYILDNNLYDEFYVKNYTNASFIANPKYSFDDGLFLGLQSLKGIKISRHWKDDRNSKGHNPQDHVPTQRAYSLYAEKTSEITGTPQPI